MSAWSRSQRRIKIFGRKPFEPAFFPIRKVRLPRPSRNCFMLSFLESKTKKRDGFISDFPVFWSSRRRWRRKSARQCGVDITIAVWVNRTVNLTGIVAGSWKERSRRIEYSTQIVHSIRIKAPAHARKHFSHTATLPTQHASARLRLPLNSPIISNSPHTSLRVTSLTALLRFGPFRPRQVLNAKVVGCLTGVRSKSNSRAGDRDGARADKPRCVKILAITVGGGDDLKAPPNRLRHFGRQLVGL